MNGEGIVLHRALGAIVKHARRAMSSEIVAAHTPRG
jgi:hypothetical protein